MTLALWLVANMATDPRTASAYVAHAVLNLNEQLDRSVEMLGVVVVGLPTQYVDTLVALTMAVVVRSIVVQGG